MELITFLVTLLLVALAFYIVTYVINSLPVSPVARNVTYAVFAIIFLLWLAKHFLGHSAFFSL